MHDFRAKVKIWSCSHWHDTSTQMFFFSYFLFLVRSNSFGVCVIYEILFEFVVCVKMMLWVDVARLILMAFSICITSRSKSEKKATIPNFRLVNMFSQCFDSFSGTREHKLTILLNGWFKKKDLRLVYTIDSIIQCYAPQRWPWKLNTVELWHGYTSSYAASCSCRW